MQTIFNIRWHRCCFCCAYLDASHKIHRFILVLSIIYTPTIDVRCLKYSSHLIPPAPNEGARREYLFPSGVRVQVGDEKGQ